MTALLCLLFFLSGVSALSFETLWFHQAGLALGNSVWASSLVLAGFMGGLGLGNGLAAWHGDRVSRPVRAYAGLEAMIGVSGVALVLVLPMLSPVLARVAGPLAETPWALNPLRLFAAFALLLLPSTAMGLTLPLLTRALSGGSTGFGGTLGRLYGWNTLGAVVGAVATETLWIGALGIHGTAWAAGGLNLLAAVGAAWLAPRMTPVAVRERVPLRIRGPALFGLAAAFAFGFLLLALEVVWFRYLSLFVFTHSVAFALMLGVVLAGIALGGLAAGRALRARPECQRLSGVLALLAGAACAGCYAAFPSLAAPFSHAQIRDAGTILAISTFLMLPVSLLSGALFPLLGAGLREQLQSDARTTGALTLANTAGAAAGALAAGFVLLPTLGVEAAIFWLAAGYAVTGAILGVTSKAPRKPFFAAGVLGLASLVLFPAGALETRVLPAVRERVSCPQVLPAEDGAAPSFRIGCDMGRVTVEEGLVETIQYVEHERLGEVYYHRLITDSYSMSGTLDFARRYMKLYVYLPYTLRGGLESALLISYGVGSTAKALTTAPGIERIDVVDISPEILALASVVHPGESNPLRDPRVTVHVEDGRYFLQTTKRRFDLITGEPPPPGAAGVVNLYTHEYFDLVRERLTPDGVASYWLPMHSLSGSAALSILRAFCATFGDCTLWNGAGLDLMLLGSNGPAAEPTVEQFVELWRHPEVRIELEALGFERPEQLAALFVGDASYLAELAGDTPMLVDDRPKRVVAPDTREPTRQQLIDAWRDMALAKRRFEASPWVAERLPAKVRAKTLPWFDIQRIIDTALYGTRHPQGSPLADAHAILTGSPVHTPVLWLLGSDSDLDRLARAKAAAGTVDPEAAYYLGVGQLARREYVAAEETLARAESSPPHRLAARLLRIYASGMAGRRGQAQQLAVELAPQPGSWREHRTWNWLKGSFGLDPGAGARGAGEFLLSEAEQAGLVALPCRALAGHVSPSCWLPIEPAQAD